jgi:predicted homoserine dehydrogenase-like protein
MEGSILHLLHARQAAGRPLRVGLIGAGKFATMFLSQARRIEGLHVAAIADLSRERAQASLSRAGWPADQYRARSLEEAMKNGSTFLAESGNALFEGSKDGPGQGVEVVVEATGDPGAGILHALRAFEQGIHVIMVNVEGDVLAGPFLAAKARRAGLVYSLAYGDQPALICELVEWARACGFDVVCAGKGTKYLPQYHASTPETVWDHWGFSAETVAKGDFNAKMFNSFLDGTKSAIEMGAVANATGLVPQAEGLGFPPCGTDDLPHVCRPQEDGGQLSRKGTVEVISSLERDGRPVYRDLRWGVYITFEGSSDYVRSCFADYGMKTDSTGRYTAMYRPYHLIGLELSISVLRAGLRQEATGSASGFWGDVVAVAKRDLAAGEILDGEGGYCVYGKLVPAERSLQIEALPLGLAHHVPLLKGVKAGHVICWSDVKFDVQDPVGRVRKEMEGQFTKKREAVAR